MDYKCPQCGAEDTQAIRMLLASGTTHMQSTGIGITGTGQIGVAAFGGTSKSELVRRFDPGPDPTPTQGIGAGVGWFAMAVGALIVILAFATGNSEASILGFVGIVLGIYVFARIPSKEENLKATQAWQMKVEVAKSGWFCHRCGAAWTPTKDA